MQIKFEHDYMWLRPLDVEVAVLIEALDYFIIKRVSGDKVDIANRLITTLRTVFEK